MYSKKLNSLIHQLIDEAKEFVLFTSKKEKTPCHILAPVSQNLMQFYRK
jgi:hypothetical protein